jgi:hypothetical protein
MRSQRAIAKGGDDMNVRTKLIGTIVVGAALLVPVAQAQRPDDQAGPRGPGAIESAQDSTQGPPDGYVFEYFGHGTAGAAGDPVRPDDRGGVRGPGAVGSLQPSTATHPDNRAGRRGPGAVTTVLVQPGSSGFDWGDALIGGLGGAGAALLLTGSAFLLLSQRNKVRTA